jgi:hypothetical protein
MVFLGTQIDIKKINCIIDDILDECTTTYSIPYDFDISDNSGVLYKVEFTGSQWINIIELDEKLPDDGESVWFYTPKFKKVLPGHFVKQDSFNRENVFISSDGGYYESLIVSHYMINRFPSAPNEKK